MRRQLALGLIAVCSFAACGDDDDEARRPVVSATPEPGHAQEVDRNPYAVTCGDLAGQPKSPEAQKLVIRAEFALAREPALRKRAREMTLNRAGRSVYWAMTEICKGRDASYRPGREAVAAVRSGKYLVQPRPEAWNRPSP
jgi:hypothetical protein